MPFRTNGSELKRAIVKKGGSQAPKSDSLPASFLVTG